MGYFLQPTIARKSLPAPVHNSRETAKNEVPQFFTVESGYRFYSPELGRWLSRDPIGERGGSNRYAFVRNWPSDTYDVLGESFVVIEDKVTLNRIATYRNRASGGGVGASVMSQLADRLESSMTAGIDMYNAAIEDLAVSPYGTTLGTAFYRLFTSSNIYEVRVAGYDSGSHAYGSYVIMMGENPPASEYTYQVVACKCPRSQNGGMTRKQVLLKKTQYESCAVLVHELRHMVDILEGNADQFRSQPTDDPGRWNNESEKRAVHEENEWRRLQGRSKKRLAYWETWFENKESSFGLQYEVVETCEYGEDYVIME